MRVPKPRTAQSGKSRAFSRAQLQRFLYTADDFGLFWRVLFETGSATGLRPGELLGMRWEDVDLENTQTGPDGEYAFARIAAALANERWRDGGELRDEFGDVLRAALEASGLTAAELAARSGCNVRTLHRYQAGLSAPTPAKAERLARSLGVDPTTFLKTPPAAPLGQPKTPGSRRTVCLTPRIVSMLREHRVTQAQRRLELGTCYVDGMDLIFANEFGEPLRQDEVTRMFKRVLKAAGLPGHFSPYSMRHSAATLLMEQDVAVKKVSEMLGHSGAAITLDVYSHVSPSMQLDVAARMSQILS